ncbi:MAG: aconitase X [Candidatus Promineifilaceae bacterium]
MSVELTGYEQAMLDGVHGAATRMAMSVIVRMAEFHGATRLLEISAAHIDSSVYLGVAGMEFAERLADLGGKLAVPATMNVGSLDEHNWREWSVPEEVATGALRQMKAYQKMGCRPTWTCAPYQVEMRPEFGQQIAWGESSAIVFANSVLGARTARYPDLMDICAAITGRVPEASLHLTENRAGQIVLDLEGVSAELQQQDSFYPVLGHLMGKRVGNAIPVINKLVGTPSEDNLKAFGAASASSGAVALFHIVGVTPEAPTLEAACQGNTDVETVHVTMEMLRGAWRELTKATGDKLDMVILGSPHFSIAEFKQLAPLVKGKKVHPNVKFLITSSRAMTMLAHKAGIAQILQEFGAQLTVDTCILVSPMLPPEIKCLMTNSAKYAYYSPGLLDTEITFGSLADCVESAVLGRVVREEGLWA